MVGPSRSDSAWLPPLLCPITSTAFCSSFPVKTRRTWPAIRAGWKNDIRPVSTGVRKYDFLGGEPGYKARWVAQRSHYEYLHFARPFSLGSIYLRSVRGAHSSKKWLRAWAPESAWNALHRINLMLRGKRAATST